MKGPVYLEPRAKWNRALIDQVNVIYSFTIIIYILVEEMEWTEAFKYFIKNIQPMEYKGLVIQNDERGKDK